MLRGAFGIVAPLLAADALSEPLDVSDPTPRPIHVAFEDSGDPGVVGTSFGPELAAFYSEQAGDLYCFCSCFCLRRAARILTSDSASPASRRPTGPVL